MTHHNTLMCVKPELKMFQRIMKLITILLTLGMPYMIFIFMSFLVAPPKYHFRFAFIFVHMSLLLGLIVLFQFTNPLRTSIMKRLKRQPNAVVMSIT